MRGMTTTSILWTLGVTSAVFFLILLPVSAHPTNNFSLGCIIRPWKMFAFKEMPDNGLCWDQVVVEACWGYCDSSEQGDYKPPYKISNHSVCTYSKPRPRRVRLRHCNKEGLNPYHWILDAVSCSCSRCNPATTSCENLNG